MERLTKKQPDGSYLAADGDIPQALDKLGRLEDLYEALLAEQASVVEKMAQLRLAGKNKTVTYQQLIANKLMVQTLLDRIRLYAD